MMLYVYEGDFAIGYMDENNRFVRFVTPVRAELLTN